MTVESKTLAEKLREEANFLDSWLPEEDPIGILASDVVKQINTTLKNRANLLRDAASALEDREARMSAAHRKLSEMLRYEGLIVVDEDNGFAEVVMEGLSLGPPGGSEIGEPST